MAEARLPGPPGPVGTPGRLGAGWPERRRGFWLLAAGVLLGHLLLANGLVENRLGWGMGDAPPARIDVAFVRELAATAPPVAAPVPDAAPEAHLPAVSAQPAASAPAAQEEAAAQRAEAARQAAEQAAREAAEQAAQQIAQQADAAASAAADGQRASEPPPPPEPVPPVALAPPPEPLPLPARLPSLAASAAALPSNGMPPAGAAAADVPAAVLAPPATTPPAPAAATAPAPPAQAFNWPPSTRMSYRLSGHYRGPVEGSAQVDWLRQGGRYQVHLETSVGPILSRHITSEGELGDSGLVPRRFDGEQKMLFRAAKRWSLRFGPDRVLLADGREVEAQPGMQDEASQFVQLTWLFTTRPDRLQVGQSIDIPLAINRKLERWTYDVVGEERLRFPFGEVATFHVKPRREAQGGDLSAEIWFAPTLQYLPVRILIRQSQDSWVDLTLEKPPMQAAAVPASR